jgi:hypothetical protein
MHGRLLSIAACIIFAFGAKSLKAQCNESFPYEFCDGNGNVHVLCSSSPCQGPNPSMPGGPWKPFRMSSIPNCIELSAGFNFEETHISVPHHSHGPSGSVINVFDPTEAATDANTALQEWLNLCHGDEEGDCCIEVNLITTRSDWERLEPGDDIFTVIAGTHWNYFPSSCTMAPCAGNHENTGMHTDVNYTPDWRLQIANPGENVWPDPTDKTVGLQDYYNGISSPPVNGSYGLLSFQQLMQHEIGHWFGLPEANEPAENGACSHSNMVMSTNNNQWNGTALILTPEDKCFFEQLYCPEYCSLGVLDPVGPPLGGGLKVYPNPATKSVSIDFDISKRDFVRLILVDILGNLVLTISDGYQDDGHYSESMNVSKLISGSYICVLQVGGLTHSARLQITR